MFRLGVCVCAWVARLENSGHMSGFVGYYVYVRSSSTQNLVHIRCTCGSEPADPQPRLPRNAPTSRGRSPLDLGHKSQNKTSSTLVRAGDVGSPDKSLLLERNNWFWLTHLINLSHKRSLACCATKWTNPVLSGCWFLITISNWGVLLLSGAVFCTAKSNNRSPNTMRQPLCLSFFGY